MAVSQAANIGANFSDYQGNPNLGGSSLGVAKIDTRPLEDLAKYTMLYNRAEYEQKQKDAEAAAKEISDYTSYDLTTSIPKDAKIIQDKYDKLIAYAKEHPDAINYRNKEEWREFKKLRNEFDNDLKMAKVRSVMNVAREKEIADETDEQLKKFKKEQLDAEINSTDIRTPIKYSQQFDLTIPDLGKNLGLKVDVTKAGSNQIFQRDYDMFDLAEANRVGAAAEIGFSNIDPNTTTGKLKLIKADQNLWVKASSILNQAIQSAKKEDGTIDQSKLASLPILKNINDFNKYVEQKRSEIASGIYKDKLGNVITFGVGPFREEDYQPINWQDGISPSELAKLKQYAEWAGDQYQTKVIQTNDALEGARIAETIRHNKASESIDSGRLKLAQDQWKDSQVGGETIKNGALERAKRIYKDMEKLADANGVISPDKTRQLNAEQLKYLGIEKVTETETGIPRSIFTPLSFDEKTDYSIQLINGEIKVMKDAKKLDNGRFSGQWDNTKSTNLFNVGTNILNEELQKAGAKELNSYMQIDLGKNGITEETDVSISKPSAPQIVNGFEVPTGATVVYSKKTGKPLGYTINGQNYKFQ